MQVELTQAQRHVLDPDAVDADVHRKMDALDKKLFAELDKFEVCVCVCVCMCVDVCMYVCVLMCVYVCVC